MEVRLLGPFEVVVDGAPIELSAQRPRAAARRARPACGQAALRRRADGGGLGRRRARVRGECPAALRHAAPACASARPARDERAGLPARRSRRASSTRPASSSCSPTGGRRSRTETPGSRAVALRPRARPLAGRGARRPERRARSRGTRRSRLDELRLAVRRGPRSTPDLRLGRHERVLAELERLVVEHPLRERLRGPADARALPGRAAGGRARLLPRRARRSSIDELGLEPSAPSCASSSGGSSATTRTSTRRPGARAAAPSACRPRRRATIGRDAELAELRGRLLDPRTRLVTLVGPGGIGKTRLASSSATSSARSFADGALLVDLAPLTEPELLLPAIARALGLREAGSASWRGAARRRSFGTASCCSCSTTSSTSSTAPRSVCRAARRCAAADRARDEQTRPSARGRAGLRRAAARRRRTRASCSPHEPPPRASRSTPTEPSFARSATGSRAPARDRA